MPTADERWFKVRIMPYRTHENRIDGLVMTFFDITQGKKLEAELIDTQIKLKALMEK
jgi:chemotaxis protein methyltransferase CheR/two-component system CheB/CheR fusion protein